MKRRASVERGCAHSHSAPSASVASTPEVEHRNQMKSLTDGGAHPRHRDGLIGPRGLSKALLESFEEGSKIRRALGGGAVDARHVQRVIGVRHEIPESRGPRQPVGE